MRTIGALLLLLACLAAPALRGADTKPKGKEIYTCAVCGKSPLTGKVWRMADGRDLCGDCEKLPQRCSLCGIPVRDTAVKSTDGRFFCAKDAAGAVLDPEKATELFEQTRRQLIELLGNGFTLKNPEIAVKLYDVNYWSNAKGADNGMHNVGFSHSRRAGNAFTHMVVLLSGRSTEEIVMTCAHEYTHLWINENRASEREIDPDTVEAICELVSYKLMGALQKPQAQQQILKNPYTKGKIDHLVAIEKEWEMPAVLNWVCNGKDREFPAVNGTFATASQAPVTPAPRIITQPQAPAPLPEELRLNGMLGRQVVFVNGQSFRTGEIHTIRLRDKTLGVECVEVRERAAAFKVEGKDQPILLELGGVGVKP